MHKKSCSRFLKLSVLDILFIHQSHEAREFMELYICISLRMEASLCYFRTIGSGHANSPC